MKLKPIVVAMPMMFALLTGCNTMDSYTSPSQFPWMFSAHHHHKHAPATVSNVLQDVMEFDKAEIKEADLAKKRVHCRKIKHFAEKVQKDHEHNLRKLHHLIHQLGVQPTMNYDSETMKVKSAYHYTKLELLSGESFDKAYIDGMVHCHHKAMHFFDRAISNSTNEKLTAFLKSTRATVARHLHEAEMLQKKWMK